MIYFKEYFENQSQFDYEQLPNVMPDDFMVESLFKIIL